MTDYYIHEQVRIMFYVNDPQISFHRYNKAAISPNVTENDFHECRPGLAVNDLSSVFHKKSEIHNNRQTIDLSIIQLYRTFSIKFHLNS